MVWHESIDFNDFNSRFQLVDPKSCTIYYYIFFVTIERIEKQYIFYDFFAIVQISVNFILKKDIHIRA